MPNKSNLPPLSHLGKFWFGSLSVFLYLGSSNLDSAVNIKTGVTSHGSDLQRIIGATCDKWNLGRTYDKLRKNLRETYDNGRGVL